MSFVPGLGIAKGMALTMRRFFAPKATIQYPETRADVAVRFRGRLQLLYDELGNIKCETCFQCAQACPVECIDMGGFDTKGRFHVHWGAAEQFAARREGSALRRSGRPVPDPAYAHFGAVDLEPVDAILKKYDYDHRKEMLAILESVQGVYGYLPVAALKRVSDVSGAPYALIYGTASYYHHLHFEEPGRLLAVCLCTACLLAGSSRIARTFAGELGTQIGRGPGEGGVSLQQLPSHIRGLHSPLVTLDGKPQTVSHSGAAAWARALAGRTVA